VQYVVLYEHIKQKQEIFRSDAGIMDNKEKVGDTNAALKCIDELRRFWYNVSALRLSTDCARDAEE